MAAKKKTKKPTLKITISGPQGIGKSSLAEALGREIDLLRGSWAPEIRIDGCKDAMPYAPLLRDALRQAARNAGVIEITTNNE